MWSSHGHSHAHAPGAGEAAGTVGTVGPAGTDYRASRLVRTVTIGILVAVAAATLVGMVALWPDYAKVAKVAERAEFSAPGVTYERGQILGLTEGCGTGAGARGEAGERGGPGSGGGQGGSGAEQGGSGTGQPAQDRCVTASVGILSGSDAGRMVSIQLRGTVLASGLTQGDHVQLIATPSLTPDEGEATGYAIDHDALPAYGLAGIERHVPLLILTLIFVIVVVAIGRIRGFLALLALGISAVVLLAFVLPALLSGAPGLLVGIVGSVAIMFITLYFVHGPNMRTTAALIGTLFGILCISGLSELAVRAARLSGAGSDSSSLLSAMVGEMDLRGLLTCSILIAGLGILNDVTITQSSAVWELRAAAPDLSRREIYARAMRIGRDHIASTVYTVFFAYIGAALSVLLLLYMYNRPLLSLLTAEDLGIEIVSTLCGGVGLILAVPITTFVAVLFTPPGREERERWAPAAAPAPAGISAPSEAESPNS